MVDLGQGAIPPSMTAPTLSELDAGADDEDWENDMRRVTEAENAEVRFNPSHGLEQREQAIKSAFLVAEVAALGL